MTDETREETILGEEAISGSASGTDAGLMWSEANQRYLAAAISALRAHLEATLRSEAAVSTSETSAHEGTLLDPVIWTFSQPPAIEQLCSAFELSAFERGVVLLAAGAEMDSRLAGFYASLDADRRSLPTLHLALTVLPEAHWSALSPSRALRRWQLIDLLPADTLITSAFRPNERILHYLAGVSGIDERLHHFVRPVPPPEMLPPSYADVASKVGGVWTDASRYPAAWSTTRQLPLIELCGAEPEANRAIAAAAAASLNLHLHAISPRNLLQASSAETNLFVRLWEREAILGATALLFECDDLPTGDAASAAVALLLESLHAPLILSSRQPHSIVSRPRAVFYTSRPTRAEQAEFWQTSLRSPHTEGKDALIDTLVAQFNLAPTAIRSAAQRAKGNADTSGLQNSIWDACRIEVRPRLEGIAQRIEATATWDDLVLPEKEREQMRYISLHVRQRIRVYEGWGFADRSSRGLGISVLFAGPSGTGKTTAAEVLAHELRLDLFRIDLSQVISKYIGETEKNLCRVFDAAEQGAAVLLFDEADALFGKRTEVKDSHDRYANCEVSYLLQRMETYRGLAILTTNRKSSLDQAFLRRLRFVVEFPFPEAAQRAEIWRRIFPPRTPVEGLNIERLSRLRVSGGNIHNIAMGAAFLAADAGEPVRMKHLVIAARTEFAKLEIPLNDAEVAGWI
jgi:AAA+ superfamily predicted ATPase